jgi:hypothetical protein
MGREECIAMKELLSTLIANAIEAGLEGNTVKCRENAEKLLARLKEEGLTNLEKAIGEALNVRTT